MNSISRCLSIRNPWADLIVRGYKSIENRSWESSYRGRIAIHASSGEAWPDFVDWLRDDAETNQDAIARLLNDDYRQPDEDRYSAIVGSVELLDCNLQHQGDVTAKGFVLPESAFADDGSDFFWRLAEPHFYSRPIPCHGKLNLWKLTPLQADAVENAEKAFLENASSR